MSLVYVWLTNLCSDDRSRLHNEVRRRCLRIEALIASSSDRLNRDGRGRITLGTDLCARVVADTSREGESINRFRSDKSHRFRRRSSRGLEDAQREPVQVHEHDRDRQRDRDEEIIVRRLQRDVAAADDTPRKARRREEERHPGRHQKCAGDVSEDRRVRILDVPARVPLHDASRARRD